MTEIRDNRSVSAWTTEEELHFVAHLGRWWPERAGSGKSERDVIVGYLAGAKRRDDWGSVDRERCMDAARARLTGANL